MDDKFVIPNCTECNEKFDNVFQAVDHMLEDGDDFDPVLILPGGYRLLIGSLLKFFYQNLDDRDTLSDIIQSTYLTLFTAESTPELIDEYVENVIVKTSMMDIDNDLKKILESGE